MCGRYQFNFDDSKISDELINRIKQLKIDNFKLGEIFPQDNVLSIIPKQDNKIDLSIKKWGIDRLINARIETIDIKPTFKNLKKCVVIANGYYEWNNKDKYYFTFNDNYIYLASLFDEMNRLVIITKEAHDSYLDIHDRMPIILNRNEMLNYLHDSHLEYTKKVPKIELVV